jgi:hypothetical protein
MPLYRWPDFRDPALAWFGEQEGRGVAEVHALTAHATFTVEGICYLAALDGAAFPGDREEAYGFAVDLVDMAHARWATGSAISAVDLCAAALGRLRCGGPRRAEKEWSLYDLSARRPPGHQLTQQGIRWIDDARADPDYQNLAELRHRFTHARNPRHFHIALPLGTPSPVVRTSFQLGPRQVPTPELIDACATVAGRHIEEFLRLAHAGSL